MKYITRIEKPIYEIGESAEGLMYNGKQRHYRIVDIKIKNWTPLSKYPKEKREDYSYTIQCPDCKGNWETNDMGNLNFELFKRCKCNINRNDHFFH